MANIFGILSAVVLAVAAFFGLKNKAALDDQQTILEREQRDLQTNEQAFEEAKEEYAGLQEDTKAATEENASLQEELDAQLATNTELQTQVDDKKSVAEAKQAEVTEGEEKLSNIGNLDDLARNVEQLGDDLAALNGELLQKNSEIETRQQALDRLNAENSNLSSTLKQYSSKESNPELQTRISRVVPDLGFVILGAGDNSGVVRDSMLDVRRDGRLIGKLQVTGTEPSTAAADIVPDSFEEGEQPRVGDVVVAGAK